MENPKLKLRKFHSPQHQKKNRYSGMAARGASSVDPLPSNTNINGRSHFENPIILRLWKVSWWHITNKHLSKSKGSESESPWHWNHNVLSALLTSMMQTPLQAGAAKTTRLPLTLFSVQGCIFLGGGEGTSMCHSLPATYCRGLFPSGCHWEEWRPHFRHGMLRTLEPRLPSP